MKKEDNKSNSKNSTDQMKQIIHDLGQMSKMLPINKNETKHSLTQEAKKIKM